LAVVVEQRLASKEYSAIFASRASLSARSLSASAVARCSQQTEFYVEKKQQM